MNEMMTVEQVFALVVELCLKVHHAHGGVEEYDFVLDALNGAADKLFNKAVELGEIDPELLKGGIPKWN